MPHGARWFGAPEPAAGRSERVRATARGDLKLKGGLIPWHNHVLRVLVPGRPFSVWLLWSPEWEFISYYVNLETPFARSAVGFDSSDHTLDVCVRSDRTWYYKDQDELDARVEVGLVDAEAAALVRRDAEQAVVLIEGWQPPFSSGLETWRPDPAWPVPELPPGWDAHASQIEPWLRVPAGGVGRGNCHAGTVEPRRLRGASAPSVRSWWASPPWSSKTARTGSCCMCPMGRGGSRRPPQPGAGGPHRIDPCVGPWKLKLAGD